MLQWWWKNYVKKVRMKQTVIYKILTLNDIFSISVNECLRILIDCSQLSKTYYNMLFGVHPKSSCTTYTLADVFGGRKSLVKPVTVWKSCNYIVVRFFHPRSSCTTTHISTENNIKSVVHDDLGWKNQTTRYILPHHWLYKWFSQFHSCGTCSVISQNPGVYPRIRPIEILQHQLAASVPRCWFAVWVLLVTMVSKIGVINNTVTRT